MFIGFYIISGNLLEERNEASAQSGINSIITEQNNIKHNAEVQLNDLAELPIFEDDFDLTLIQLKLTEIKKGNTSIDNMIFTIDDKQFISLNELSSDFKPSDRDWYQAAVKGNGHLAWGVPFQDKKTGSIVNTVARTLTNKKGEQAVLSLNISYKDITSVLQELTIGHTGTLSIVSSNGIRIAGTDSEKVGEDLTDNKIYQEVAKSSKQQGTIAIKDNPEVSQVYFDKGKEGDQSWVLGTIHPEEYAAETHSLILSTFIISVVMLILVSIFTFFVQKVIKEIILVFVDYFAQMEQGSYQKIPKKQKTKGGLAVKARNYVYPDESGTEIHRVAASYNKMIDTTGQLLSSIQTESQKVATMSNSLLELSRQTSSATSDVTETITGIAEVTGTQAQETEGSVVQLQQLSDVVQELNSNVTTMNQQSTESIQINQ